MPVVLPMLGVIGARTLTVPNGLMYAALAVAHGMGGGDVELAALLGAVAGVSAILSLLPVAVFGGAVAALTLAVVRRSGGVIPYGPFLAGGAVLALV